MCAAQAANRSDLLLPFSYIADNRQQQVSMCALNGKQAHGRVSTPVSKHAARHVYRQECVVTAHGRATSRQVEVGSPPWDASRICPFSASMLRLLSSLPRSPPSFLSKPACCLKFLVFCSSPPCPGLRPQQRRLMRHRPLSRSLSTSSCSVLPMTQPPVARPRRPSGDRKRGAGSVGVHSVHCFSGTSRAVKAQTWTRA